LQPNDSSPSFLNRNRFVILFFSLLLFLLAVPILHHLGQFLPPRIPLVLEGLAFIFVLVEAAVSVSDNRAHRFIALSLGLPAVLLGAVHGIFDSMGVELFRHVFGAAFLCYAIALMLFFIFTRQRVTFNTVCASLCIYLLLGVVWAMAYSVVDLFDPESFRSNVANGTDSPFTRFGRGTSTHVLYFSFTTLTTLGYGDIVPVSAIARALTSIEAITGQIYLAVLVARLVGLNIAESMGQKRDDGEGGRSSR
jgi:hypothetical protein